MSCGGSCFFAAVAEFSGDQLPFLGTLPSSFVKCLLLTKWQQVNLTSHCLQNNLWRSRPAPNPWVSSPAWRLMRSSAAGAAALPPPLCAPSHWSPPPPSSPARRWLKSPVAWKRRSSGTNSTNWAQRWSSPSREGSLRGREHTEQRVCHTALSLSGVWTRSCRAWVRAVTKLRGLRFSPAPLERFSVLEVGPAIARCGFKTPHPEMDIFPHSVVFAPTQASWVRIKTRLAGARLGTAGEGRRAPPPPRYTIND